MPSALHRRRREMPDWYRRTIKVLSSLCDRYQHMRLSSLFSVLQEVSISDVERLGVPRSKTLDRGLLWVISRIRIELERPICYDEMIEVSTIAGEMTHMLFPRYYEIRDAEGNVILRGSAVWLLIYENSRLPVPPQREGIEIHGVSEAGMPSLPMGLRSIESDIPAVIRKVMYTDIDLNGHMNNTRYLDWIDDMYDMHFHEVTRVSEFQINYLKELSCGEQVTLYYEYGDKVYRIDGIKGGKAVFSASMRVEKL